MDGDGDVCYGHHREGREEKRDRFSSVKAVLYIRMKTYGILVKQN
jgi:hypothetical protein